MLSYKAINCVVYSQQCGSRLPHGPLALAWLVGASERVDDATGCQHKLLTSCSAIQNPAIIAKSMAIDLSKEKNSICFLELCAGASAA